MARFYARGYCMRGDSCHFLHDPLHPRDPLHRGTEEMEGVEGMKGIEGNEGTERLEREEAGRPESTEGMERTVELWVVDESVTVRTLDVERHFATAGRVQLVRYMGLGAAGARFRVRLGLVRGLASAAAVLAARQAIGGVEVLVEPISGGQGSEI